MKQKRQDQRRLLTAARPRKRQNIDRLRRLVHLEKERMFSIDIYIYEKALCALVLSFLLAPSSPPLVIFTYKMHILLFVESPSHDQIYNIRHVPHIKLTDTHHFLAFKRQVRPTRASSYYRQW